MSAWIALAVVAIGSYVFRLVPVVAIARVSLPPSVDRALGYAGPSAMTALTVTAIVHQQQTTDGITTVGALLALALGGWLAFRKHSFLAAVASGLVLYGAWLAFTGNLIP